MRSGWDLSDQDGHFMIDPEEIIRKAVADRNLKSDQELKATDPRKVAASILKSRFEEAIKRSGGDPLEDSMQQWIEHFFKMYVLLAVPLDHFPDWRDDGLPDEAASDFFNRWMNKSADALNAISPGLGK